MSSAEALRAESALLLDVARASIEHGLAHGRPLEPDPAQYPPSLREDRATFVTLRIGERLRGCTGTLEAQLPLVVEVARTAWRSAFRDPRFAPLEPYELPDVALHVSVLNPLEPLPVESESHLLGALRPHVDGLVLRDGAAAATFLPTVWESLPEPERFLRELKRKAGLPPAHWSPTIRFERFTVDEVE